MRRCIDAVKPDAVVHLGDYYEDGEVIAREYPHLIFHRVAGNCDKNRAVAYAPETLCYPIGGVTMYLTHGHIQRVKQGLGGLLADARRCKAQAVLYGHTHRAQCFCEDGLWVLNPGTCGYGGGTAGYIETDGQTITVCRILEEEIR